MNLVILLLTVIIVVQIYCSVQIIRGLHQLAKNQVGATKMILEYLQVFTKQNKSKPKKIETTF